MQVVLGGRSGVGCFNPSTERHAGSGTLSAFNSWIVAGVKMRHDIILVVIGQSAGPVVTEADNGPGRRRGLRDFHFMMRTLARGHSRARAERQGQRDTEQSQPA